MNSASVSIVITTMDRLESVQRAIRSVLAQTYCDYNLHVVDDGSTDKTPEVVRQIFIGRENAFYWRHDHRRGLCAARNTGIRKSKGEFLAFLDDDDEWKSDSLEKRMAVVRALSPADHETLGVVYTGCEVRIPHENRTTYNMPQMEGDIADGIRTSGLSTIPSTGLHPRTALEKIGGFDESLISSVDHDLWMSLAHHGFHALAVREPLTITYIRKRQKNMVSDTRPRICGVEQYLEKWRPTYADWFGEDGARKYVKSYRTNVLGRLAATKFFDGEVREAWRLLLHVTRRSGLTPSEHFRLFRFFALMLARKCAPLWLIDLVKGRSGSSQED